MTKPSIQLVGQDGNAFFILGRCQREARKVGWTTEEIKKFMDEAKSGDYNHLLCTVMDNFNCDCEDEDEEDNWMSEDIQNEMQDEMDADDGHEDDYDDEHEDDEGNPW